MNIAIIGAGLAGATAYQLLKRRHYCTVYEAKCHPSGMLCDRKGIQWYGPRAFHTDSEKAWAFITQFAEFKPFDLRVEVQTDPIYARELPFTDYDPAWKIYSEKAWGRAWENLPAFVTDRVPALCTDGRTGYHAGIFKGQPLGGYYAMIEKMLAGANMRWGIQAEHMPEGHDVIVWTGNLNSLSSALGLGVVLPWIGRSWVYSKYASLYTNSHVINYATRRVPQIRSWTTSINPYHDGGKGVMSEFFSDEIKCYPCPESTKAASELLAHISTMQNIIPCGRLGSYQYLDMDKCILNVMDAVERAGL